MNSLENSNIFLEILNIFFNTNSFLKCDFLKNFSRQWSRGESG